MFVASTARGADTARQPNIVFIIADDLGWADVGFHGGRVATPNLDKLASGGVELRQHYVAPVCSPTRTGLMTGRFWSRFNVTSPQNERALPWDTVTLPRALKSVGYDTCITGKWHLGSKPEWGPNHFGFDHSFGSLAGGVGPWNHFYKQGEFTRTWHRNEQFVDTPGHVTDLITDEATGWLKSRGAKPFFLYVPFTAVHLPIKEPEEWVKKVPAAIQGDVARHYAACTMHLDASVGRIVEMLEKIGQRENTLLVFTSDNGGIVTENNDTKYPADDYPTGKLTGNNLPLRDQKGSLYEGGIRVPTIASWPGKLKSAKVDTPAHITDWMPTLTTLAGYQPSADLKWDGTNIGAVLTDGATLPSRTLYWVAPGWRARAVRVGNWKLVVTTQKNASNVELFDLAADPSETTNLAEKEPAHLAELQQQLDKIGERDRDAAVPKGE